MVFWPQVTATLFDGKLAQLCAHFLAHSCRGVCIQSRQERRDLPALDPTLRPLEVRKGSEVRVGAELVRALPHVGMGVGAAVYAAPAAEVARTAAARQG